MRLPGIEMSRTKRLLTGVLACLFSWIVVAHAAGSDVSSDTEKKVAYKVVDWDQNRFVQGDPHRFQKPAEINMLDVLMKIPAYQQVVREKLTSKDSRYYFLMQEATRELVKAVDIVTRKTGHDLVADVGAVKAEGGEVPNLTQQVIDALGKK